MRHINAVQLRQSLAQVVKLLEKNGEPVMLDKGRKPVAVLISLRDFEERFSEKAAHEAREALAREIDELAIRAKDPSPSEQILRAMRDK